VEHEGEKSEHAEKAVRKVICTRGLSSVARSSTKNTSDEEIHDGEPHRVFLYPWYSCRNKTMTLPQVLNLREGCARTEETGVGSMHPFICCPSVDLA